MMNILHLNTYDAGGGAAIAALRLHSALLEQKIASQFGVLHKTTDQIGVLALSTRMRRALQPILSRLEQLPLHFYSERDKTVLFSQALFPTIIHHKIAKINPDIVHLHWVVNNFVSIFSLARLKKPVLWTLHDTWAFTGGCHILKGCTNYLTGCRTCPQLGSYSPLNLAHLNFIHKKSAYIAIQPTLVAPSRRMQERIQKSQLLGSFRCEHIPNAIDTRIFNPIEKKIARSILTLPDTGKVIAFGAVSATSDPNKGYDLLMQTMQRLRHYTNSPVHLLVFGTSQLQDMQALTYPATCLGILHDALALRLAYSAADVFVCPSREENLPNTIMESLACGTPVVGFDVGGNPDMIDHERNGWLAPPHDPETLAQGLAFVLNDDTRRQCMSEAARQTVLERYASKGVARQYINLYNEILDAHKFGSRNT